MFDIVFKKNENRSKSDITITTQDASFFDVLDTRRKFGLLDGTTEIIHFQDCIHESFEDCFRRVKTLVNRDGNIYVFAEEIEILVQQGDLIPIASEDKTYFCGFKISDYDLSPGIETHNLFLASLDAIRNTKN